MLSLSALLFLFQTLLLQHVSGQYIGAYSYPDAYGAAPYAAAYSPWNAAAPYAVAPYGGAPYAAGLCTDYLVGAPATLTASHGPGLTVTSASPSAPTGVTAVSETAYNGGLAVAGQIPFLSAVALEGALPTSGAGGISYTCSNGNIAILNEDLASTGYAPYAPSAYGYGGVATGPIYGYGPVASGPVYGYAPVPAGPTYGYGTGCNCGCGAVY